MFELLNLGATVRVVFTSRRMVQDYKDIKANMNEPLGYVAMNDIMCTHWGQESSPRVYETEYIIF